MRSALLLQLRVLHAYHGGVDCPDIEVRPTAETAALLQGHRMTWRPSAKGYALQTLLHEDGAPYVAMAPTARLQFELWPLHPGFVSYTSYAAYGGSPKYLNFSNQTTSPRPDGSLLLTTTATTDTPYAGRPLGMVKLDMNTIVGPSALPIPPSYTITFEAAAQQWTYCVLARPQLLDPVIEDIDSQTRFERIDLGAQGITDQTLAQLGTQLMAEYPGRRPYLFRSPAPIAWSASPRKGLRLLDGIDTVLDHLANPSPSYPAMLFLHA